MRAQPIVYLCKPSDTPLVSLDKGVIELFMSDNIGSNLVTFTDSPAQATIIILFEEWSFKLRAYAKQLLADAFFIEHAEKILVINYDDTISEPFLPGCYTSLKLSCYDPSRFSSSTYPLVYNSLSAHKDSKATTEKPLYWFRGTPKSHPIRARLFHALASTEKGLLVDVSKDFHTHTSSDKQQYVTEMSNCHFVLCPRGHSPNSYRLYEAMSLGKCPVIISDEWVPSEGPDWSSCSIRIAEKDIAKMEGLLVKRMHESSLLGINARLEWEKYFAPKVKNKFYLQLILRLYEQASPPTKSIREYKKHWNSHRFLKNNGWLFSQRLARKFSAIFK